MRSVRCILCIRCFSAAAALVLLSACDSQQHSNSADSPKAQYSEVDFASRVQWLSTHAAPLRTFDSESDDFTDLAPLGRAIGSARVVLLGDPGVGDSASVHTIARVVRYLHSNHGFDVVAFESGFFDAQRAWRALVDESETPNAQMPGVPPLLASSAEFQPMTRYISRMSKSMRPLELAGFDSQLNGPLARTHFTSDLRAHLRGIGVDITGVYQWSEIEKSLDALVDPRTAASEWTGARQLVFTSAIDSLTRLLQTRASTSDEDLFWIQMLRSARGYAVQTYSAVSGDLYAATRARHGQMGDNLLWLVNTRYPGRRIVVWGTSIHTARELVSVNFDEHPLGGRLNTAMGAFVSRSLGENVYSIGLIVSDGSAGRPGGATHALTPPDSSSIEGLFSALTNDASFLDLRAVNAGAGAAAGATAGTAEDAGAEWLRAPMLSAPFGFTYQLAVWPQVFDGLIHSRRTAPLLEIR